MCKRFHKKEKHLIFTNFILKDYEFHIWSLGILGTLLQFHIVSGIFETFLVDGKFKGLSNKPLYARF
jgi:hypothetical protein